MQQQKTYLQLNQNFAVKMDEWLKHQMFGICNWTRTSGSVACIQCRNCVYLKCTKMSYQEAKLKGTNKCINCMKEQVQHTHYELAKQRGLVVPCHMSTEWWAASCLPSLLPTIFIFLSFILSKLEYYWNDYKSKLLTYHQAQQIKFLKHEN